MEVSKEVNKFKNRRSVYDISDDEDDLPRYVRKGRSSRPEQTTLRGVVTKMDDAAQKAHVRIVIEQDGCPLSCLNTETYAPVDVDHLFIPYRVTGSVGETSVEKGSIVKILEYNGPRIQTDIGHAMFFTKEEPAEITRYTVDRTDMKQEQKELVAVAKIFRDYLIVVNVNSSGGNIYNNSECIVARDVVNWKNLAEHDFLYASLVLLPEYYKVEVKDEASVLVFEHAARLTSIKLFEKDEVEQSAARRLLVTKIRLLSQFECETIRQHTRNLSTVNMNQALQYILEPNLTSVALDEYLTKESEKEFAFRKYKVIKDENAYLFDGSATLFCTDNVGYSLCPFDNSLDMGLNELRPIHSYLHVDDIQKFMVEVKDGYGITLSNIAMDNMDRIMRIFCGHDRAYGFSRTMKFIKGSDEGYSLDVIPARKFDYKSYPAGQSPKYREASGYQMMRRPYRNLFTGVSIIFLGDDLPRQDIVDTATVVRQRFERIYVGVEYPLEYYLENSTGIRCIAVIYVFRNGISVKLNRFLDAYRAYRRIRIPVIPVMNNSPERVQMLQDLAWYRLSRYFSRIHDVRKDDELDEVCNILARLYF